MLETTADSSTGMRYRVLGRTGERVSLIGLGGAHLISRSLDEQDTIRIIQMAINNGVTFLDNSWDYGDGEAERRMGIALRGGLRQKVFLMTKIDGQTRASAIKQLDECLSRLQTDVIDLLQFHEIIRPEDPERIFSAGGFDAIREAQKAGKVRYIGFTGHKDPEIHLAMVNAGLALGYTFDTVQMPLNVMDAHFQSFERKVLPLLAEHGIGVLGMKPICSGRAVKSGTVSAVECLQYAMNLPTSVVITGCDSLSRLEQALLAARTFRRWSPAEMASLLARTAPAGTSGEYEPWKSTHDYDSTVEHPEYLG